MSKHYNLSYLMGKSLRAMASVIIIDSSRVCSATLTHGVKFYVWLSVYMSDCMNCPCHDLQSWQKENTIFSQDVLGQHSRYSIFYFQIQISQFHRGLFDIFREGCNNCATRVNASLLVK